MPRALSPEHRRMLLELAHALVEAAVRQRPLPAWLREDAALCLIYIAITYIRPGEIIPGWIGFPFLEIGAGIAAFAGVVSLVFHPRAVGNLPNDWCFLAYGAAIVRSLPANGWVGGGYLALLSILPLIVFYFLIRLAVQTEAQLRWLSGVLVLLTLFQAGNGFLQYHTGTGLGGSTAHVRVQYDPETGDEGEEVKRVRGTGIFGDPNDLAMSLIVVIPFLFSAVFSGQSGFLGRSWRSERSACSATASC